jgi:hypothetical protein
MPNTAAGRQQAYLKSQSVDDLKAGIRSLQPGEMRSILEDELQRRLNP